MNAAARPHFCPRCGTRRNSAGGCDRDGTALAEITDHSLLGTQIGNYVVVRRLGEGGMGAVYRAVQPAIGAQVAIKVLYATGESQGSAVQRFLLEARAVNRVQHPNLIKILDTGELPDKRPYLVMELLDGLALVDAIGKLPWPLACHVAAEALDALDAVHAHDIVHRDLKPANIFLGRGGRVVVLDFGIAKLVSPDAVAVTGSGLIGTPEYMSPEQIRSQPLDRRTDIYAMGVLLYEAITGRRPFTAAATFDMLVQHVERAPPSPREWTPELPVAVAEIVLHALAKEPAERFSSAAAMAAALRSQLPPGAAALGEFIELHAPPPLPAPLEPSADAGETTPFHAGGERTGSATVAERPRSDRRPSPAEASAPAPARARSRGRLVGAIAAVVGIGAVCALAILHAGRAAGVAPISVDASVAAMAGDAGAPSGLTPPVERPRIAAPTPTAPTLPPVPKAIPTAPVRKKHGLPPAALGSASSTASTVEPPAEPPPVEPPPPPPAPTATPGRKPNPFK